MKHANIEDPERPLAQDLCDYIQAAPSPFHAVTETLRRLQGAGFQPLSERDVWQLQPGDARYVTRSDASLIAFRVGTASPAEAGFRIVGAHTDSPNLRLKPRPVFSREGYVQLGVEVYGGVLLHTWADRDLGLAGRLIVDSGSKDLERFLVCVDEPLCRMTSLAIHLNREINDQGAVYNKQTQLAPIFALGDEAEASRNLFSRLADLCGVGAEQIRGFDLGLYDLCPPTLGGAHQEFVYAARLDNLASAHAATTALARAFNVSPTTRVIALFDHEEIGSTSAQGASGSFLRDVLGRILEATGGVGEAQARRTENAANLSRAIAHSFMISADMAHAVHPSFADKHEPQHKPVLGGGPVVKSNVQQRYATDGLSAAHFRRLCGAAGVPCQDFVSRTDLSCGSTIGPITAAKLGIHGVDVGSPMLSMHSARELCGAADVEKMVQVMELFFG